MSNLNEKEKLLMTKLVRDLADLNLFEYLDNRVRFDMWEQDYFFAYHHLGIDNINWGATKICIDFGKDWVIKIGFNETTYDNLYDYCEREYLIYCDAVKQGIDRYFPETVRLCKYNGQNVYAQKKLQSCEDELISTWSDAVEAALLDFGTISAEDKDSDEYWAAVDEELEELTEFDRLYPLFGKEKDFDKLMDFVYEYGINDLHQENIMEDYCGHYMIADFSGYY